MRNEVDARDGGQMGAAMEYEEIIGLIDHVAASGLSSFTYEADGMKLSMKGRQPVVGAAGAVSLSQGSMSGQQAAQDREIPFAADAGLGQSGESAGGPDAAAVSGKIVTSPLVGTFYVAPAEGAEPYVRVGDSVQKGQVLAIVEAMKLMNEIESDFDGVVKKILVQDGEPVEYGQPLFCLE